MKRYVLLENNTITKVNKDDYKIFVNTLIFGDTQLGKIKLQSDNLLDLLEVGGMVEIDNEGIDYIHITKDYPASKVNELTLDFEIIAIWKRQGDIMRRYER